MRAITGGQVAAFGSMLTLIIALAMGATAMIDSAVHLGGVRSAATWACFAVWLYLAAFAVYRAFLGLMPLREGELVAGSRDEFVAQVNILFYLLLFNTLIRSHVLPVPLMRLVYLALGARLGSNTYSAGAILDPPLTSTGDNCIIGHDAVLFAHAIEGRHMSLARIELGDNVTIGATAVVMSDVRIGDGAIVSAGAVVRKGTRIGPGEVWGGVPARRIAGGAAAVQMAPADPCRIP